MRGTLNKEFQLYLDNYSGYGKNFKREDLEYFVKCIKYSVDRKEFMYRVTNGESLVECMLGTFERVKKDYSSMDKIISCAAIVMSAGESVGVEIRDSND